MQLILDTLNSLRVMPFPLAALWAFVGNIVIFLLTLVIGQLLVHRFQDRLVSEPAPSISPLEGWLAASCIFLNAIITALGILLWRVGIVEIQFELNILKVLADVLLIFFAMDVAMYFLHRIAHFKWLYPFVHQTHHRYENPRPLTLFVLNPFETLSFGLLWLVVISLYTASWLGIVIYLSLNLTFGLMGHLGVEPMPKRWLKIPLLRYISTSTFHSEHHQDAGHNFGFYTLIWDHLFGTLSPEYQGDFARATAKAPF